MSIAPATVTVHSPDGVAERHTRQNARDLVNLSGYSWMPHIKANPNHPSSFAGRTPPKGPSPAQEVLNRAGGTGNADAAAEADAQLDAEIAEQQRQLAEMQAAAQASVAQAAPVADFSMPVEEPVDPAIEALLDGEGDADVEAAEADADAAEAAAADEPSLQPTARSRKRIGRSA